MVYNQQRTLKIFNDPIYGFIEINHPLVLDVINHSYFQRLRRISQTGLTDLVYPGATHSRFHHALGCLHLMQKALQTLEQKGVEISEEEKHSTCLAILLHDVGHGPFSHALERNILPHGHEELSLAIMENLNKEFNGELDLCIKIFKGEYHKKFLKSLISSQLDVDRLDYLKRDSFYTGVSEGNVNSDRLISMFNVIDNELVVDIKGIYSVEKFLVARIFMYWQVYLHKTSVAAESILNQTLVRAKDLVRLSKEVPCSARLSKFIHNKIDSTINPTIIDDFTFLDDNDIITALKDWVNHEDSILSSLSKMLIFRKLPYTYIQQEQLIENDWQERINNPKLEISPDVLKYFFQRQELKIEAYRRNKNPIKLRYKNNDCIELTKAPQQIMKEVLIKQSVKYHYTELKPEKNWLIISWLKS